MNRFLLSKFKIFFQENYLFIFHISLGVLYSSVISGEHKFLETKETKTKKSISNL